MTPVPWEDQKLRLSQQNVYINNELNNVSHKLRINSKYNEFIQGPSIFERHDAA